MAIRIRNSNTALQLIIPQTPQNKSSKKLIEQMHGKGNVKMSTDEILTLTKADK